MIQVSSIGCSATNRASIGRVPSKRHDSTSAATWLKPLHRIYEGLTLRGILIGVIGVRKCQPYLIFQLTSIGGGDLRFTQ